MSSTGDATLALNLMARRLTEHAGKRRVWLDPELPGALRALDLRCVDTPALAEMAAVRAPRIGPRGELLQPQDAIGLPGRVWAWFDPSAGDRIVGRDDGPRRGRADRIISPYGFIEVRAAGLVITELARGVSARDVQAFSEPPLLIDPQVDEMRLSPRPDGDHDGAHGVA